MMQDAEKINVRYKYGYVLKYNDEEEIDNDDMSSQLYTQKK